ncbi:UNVERIFIED_CONTAM: hypothetical protein K2H54_026225 [Gekko kuhli]
MAATISLYFATTGATGGVMALSALKSTVIRQRVSVLPLRWRVSALDENACLFNCATFRLIFYPYVREFLDPRVRINGWHGQRGFQSRTAMYRIDKVRAPRKLPEEAIGQINGDTVAVEKASSENPIVLSLIVTGSYRGRKVSHC